MLLNWQDLIDAIEGVGAAVGDLEARISTSLSLQIQCCDSVTAPAPPPPDYTTPPPPPGGEEPPPAAYPTPEAYDAYLCQLANWIWWLYRRIVGAIAGLDLASLIVIVIVSLVGVLLPEGLTTAVGGLTLTTIATYIVAYQAGIEVLAGLAQLQADYMDDNRQEAVCLFYGAFANGDSLMDGVADAVQSWLGTHLPAELAEKLTAIISLGEGWILNQVHAAADVFGDVPGAVGCECLPSPTPTPYTINQYSYGIPDGWESGDDLLAWTDYPMASERDNNSSEPDYQTCWWRVGGGDTTAPFRVSAEGWLPASGGNFSGIAIKAGPGGAEWVLVEANLAESVRIVPPSGYAYIRIRGDANNTFTASLVFEEEGT